MKPNEIILLVAVVFLVLALAGVLWYDSSQKTHQANANAAAAQANAATPNLYGAIGDGTDLLGKILGMFGKHTGNAYQNADGTPTNEYIDYINQTQPENTVDIFST